MMFISRLGRATVYPFASATQKCHLFLFLRSHLISTTSQPVSCLTDKCEFSQESPLKLFSKVRFNSIRPSKADSTIAFFRTHGFSDAQITKITTRVPAFLRCNPNKRILPKLQFLASKGASNSDILRIVTGYPELLLLGLKNGIVPAFDLINRFLSSDEKTMNCVISSPASMGHFYVSKNVKLLLDEGLTHSQIKRLFQCRPSVLASSTLWKTVAEVKKLGVDPSLMNFSVALMAKKAVAKSGWDAKVEACKTWGWSEEQFSDVFRKHPQIMLRSEKKIIAVMSFWVGKLGWDPSLLCVAPVIFGLSLEERIIPRALVVQYLLSKGLMKKDASLATPFFVTHKKFLERYVTRFEKHHSSQLLKLLHSKTC
ncbi:hypothetical protein HN51_063957 [Arachis hypogaea]|uniref:Uncharacterized protein n=1 Tax=Arachis hypogaea TaxID=3818 RepID=A0A445AW69_ARAHY|nr:transcription termination factor MTERF5, chloroplastic [Arachis ipaensis]XP_025630275.1 transcription termination factor MTERF5, chloroplastic [Arachis hypogaea]RYR30672.1 hypothetical protein Ahy_B01g055424 [Arachis hypogaea]